MPSQAERRRLRTLRCRLQEFLYVASNEVLKRRERCRAARSAAAVAERLELIRRPKGCEWCRRRLPLERHHWDYRWPLDVWWFCRDCHRIADGMNRLEEVMMIELTDGVGDTFTISPSQHADGGIVVGLDNEALFLGRDLVGKLAKILAHFAEHGRLPEADGEGKR